MFRKDDNVNEASCCILHDKGYAPLRHEAAIAGAVKEPPIIRSVVCCSTITYNILKVNIYAAWVKSIDKKPLTP